MLWAAFVVALLVLALRYAPTRAGWPLAVAASVLVTPRLLMYQLSTLQAGGPRHPIVRGTRDGDAPPRGREEAGHRSIASMTATTTTAIQIRDAT